MRIMGFWWGLLVAAALFPAMVLLGAGPALAAPETPRLSLEVLSPLTSADEPVEIRARGFVDDTWPEAEVQVRVYGPGWPPGGAGRQEMQAWPVTDLEPRGLGRVEGSFSTAFTLTPEDVPSEGAYRVRVTVGASDGRKAVAETWLGRVPADPPPVEVAVVWSSALGTHWDSEGRLVDGVLEAAVVPKADASGSLYSLLTLPERFPSWSTTVAVEPAVLAQLRKMANGYDLVEDSGEVVTREPEEELPLLTGQTLSTFKRVAGLDSFQILPGPYAMPALSLLAREDWGDGVEQVRLGRREVESTLGLAGVPDGAYPPGLELTTDSLQYFSSASVDYALVAEELAGDLAEEESVPSGPVRVRDRDNNRLTLLFADADLRSALGPPWDANLLLALLAAKMAQGEEGPFLVAPGEDYELPPAGFIRRLGESLTGSSWIRTLTLDQLIASHPPDTRPVFLTRYGGYLEGFVQRGFLESLREAHGSLRDLSSALPEDTALLDDLQILLFQAESRYWFMNSGDPDVVNLGLSFAQRVEEEVAAYLDQVDVAEDKSVLVVGEEGEVPVAVVNKTGHPLDVELAVESDDVVFRSGARVAATLGVQENIFSFPVRIEEDAVVTVRVMAGNTLVDEGTVEVRSLSIWSLLPWVAGALVVLAAGGWLVMRRR